MATPCQTVLYAGEDKLEQLDHSRSMRALSALTAALDSGLLAPATAVQCGNALDGLQPPTKEFKALLSASHSATTIAALIAAESDLHAVARARRTSAAICALNGVQAALRVCGIPHGDGLVPAVACLAEWAAAESPA